MPRITRYRRAKMVIGLALAVVGWLGAFYNCALFVHGYRLSFRPPYRAVIGNNSSVEDYGLRVTLQSVNREGDRLRVGYALEWVPLRKRKCRFIFVGPWDVPLVELWDADRRRIPGQFPPRALREVPRQFLDEEVNLWEQVEEFVAPEEACYIAVGLGDLMTNPVRIPRDRR
jgi:hypothetical protein